MYITVANDNRCGDMHNMYVYVCRPHPPRLSAFTLHSQVWPWPRIQALSTCAHSVYQALSPPLKWPVHVVWLTFADHIGL